MNDFSNSAKRIENFILKVHTKPDNLSAAEVWADAFGLDVNQAKNDPHEVNQKLTLLRHELDAVEQQMLKTKFSPELFNHHINSLRVVITPRNITSPWSTYKNNFRADVMLSLKFCSEILETEPTADFEELQELLSKLQNFKQELDSSSLTGATYNFIIKQIGIIENAIKNYPIMGGSAIKEAFAEGFNNIATTNAQDIEENETTKNLKNYWNTLYKAANKITEANKIANALISIVNKGQNLFETITAALPPGA